MFSGHFLTVLPGSDQCTEVLARCPPLQACGPALLHSPALGRPPPPPVWSPAVCLRCKSDPVISPDLLPRRPPLSRLPAGLPTGTSAHSPPRLLVPGEPPGAGGPRSNDCCLGLCSCWAWPAGWGGPPPTVSRAEAAAALTARQSPCCATGWTEGPRLPPAWSSWSSGAVPLGGHQPLTARRFERRPSRCSPWLVAAAFALCLGQRLSPRDPLLRYPPLFWRGVPTPSVP